MLQVACCFDMLPVAVRHVEATCRTLLRHVAGVDGALSIASLRFKAYINLQMFDSSLLCSIYYYNIIVFPYFRLLYISQSFHL